MSVVVRIEETDEGETAFVDDRPVSPRPEETAREAALRTVLDDADSARDVDIHTPAGVVLHVRAHPGGRLDILGQSAATTSTDVADADRAESTTRERQPLVGTGCRSRSGSFDQANAGGLGSEPSWISLAPGADTVARETAAADLDDWPERDQAWPVPPDALGPSTTGRSAGPMTAASGTATTPPGSPPEPEAAVVTPPARLLRTATLAARPRRRLRLRRLTDGRPAAAIGGSEGSADDPDRPGVTTNPGAATASRIETPTAAESPARRRTVRAAVGTLVLATVAALTLGGVVLFRAGQEPPPVHVAAGVDFPHEPPDGWARTARWAGPALDPDSRVAVVPAVEGPSPNPETIAFVTADHALAALDPATGATRWSAPLPQGPIAAGPGATHLAGVAAVAVQAGRHIAVRAAGDGRVLAQVELPDHAELVLAGTAPMVRLSPTSVALLDADGLRTVEVPAGATPLAGRPDGTVLAGNARGWWHLRPSTVPGPPTTWEQAGSPSDGPTTSPVLVGALGSAVVLAHPDPERPRLVVHHDGATVRASFQGTYVPSRDAVWAPSPSGTWGILGRSLVDVQTGQVSDLGDWRTVLVAEDRAYGVVNGTLLLAGPDRTPAPVNVRTALVEAVSSAGALVRAESGQGRRIWLLHTTARQ